MEIALVMTFKQVLKYIFIYVEVQMVTFLETEITTLPIDNTRREIEGEKGVC